MRFVSGLALYGALISILLFPASAAPAQQMADAPGILGASAQVMDAAQSMSFSGAMDMSVSTGGSTKSMRMPMSGAFQAPDRMTMTVQIPDMNTSRDMVIVGGQLWKRTGRGPWVSAPVAVDASASPLGMSHTEWVSRLMNPVATDLGTAHRVTASLDVSDALRAGYGAAAASGTSGSTPADLSGLAQVALNIDKATSHLVSMQMDLVVPVPDRAVNVAVTMSLDFSDFNSMAVEILPPV